MTPAEIFAWVAAHASLIGTYAVGGLVAWFFVILIACWLAQRWSVEEYEVGHHIGYLRGRRDERTVQERDGGGLTREAHYPLITERCLNGTSRRLDR